MILKQIHVLGNVLVFLNFQNKQKKPFRDGFRVGHHKSNGI